jgi:ribonucleoside-diphosphate reductase subunit M1
MRITTRSGKKEEIDLNKITERIKKMTDIINSDILDPVKVSLKVLSNIKEGIKTSELDEMTAQICINWSLEHPDWGVLGSRLIVDNHKKNISISFTETINLLYNNLDSRGYRSPLISDNLYYIVSNNNKIIEDMIKPDRDFLIDFFGFKTLERSYLLKINDKIVETPQYMWMRVSLGIWGNNLEKVKRTYDLMSQKYFTHATPTLFNMGTPYPASISCFLIGTNDSLNGIYKTITDCAKISKWSGGIGVHISNIRSNGSVIRKTGGKADGILPMLKVFNETARHINQGGKRLGSFAIYLEPWHADIFSFLDAKKNHGNDNERARDLFYALWIPDLFMERVLKNEDWCLMCPDESPGLQDCYGKEFEDLYNKYEKMGNYREKLPARKVWSKILISQIETGMPYMLYKDSINRKNNQENKGIIKSSNLCAEIVEYSDKDNTACCNLASISLQSFLKDQIIDGSMIDFYGKDDCMSCCAVKSILKEKSIDNYNYIDLNDYNTRNEFYSKNKVKTVPQIFFNGEKIGGFEDFVKFIRPTFDYVKLREVVHQVVENLDKIIDINYYPIPETIKSNSELRPIGIGVQGLADVFAQMYLPFTSDESKKINERIFERIQFFSTEKSIELAKEKGRYPLYEGSPISKGKFQHNLWGFDDPNDDWELLRNKIKKYGIRNSLLTALMPTASTSQILGNNESFEAFTSNMYVRRTLAGEFIVINKYLIKLLNHMGIYNKNMKYTIMHFRGNIKDINKIPNFVKELFKTSWNMKNKDLIDMSADRGKYVDQSQSFNIFIEDPNENILSKIHLYGWKSGLKTGLYYLRSKPSTSSQTFTIDPDLEMKIIEENKENKEKECLMCSS